jgi:hypothetical protein
MGSSKQWPALEQRRLIIDVGRVRRAIPVEDLAEDRERLGNHAAEETAVQTALRGAAVPGNAVFQY